MRQCGLVSKPAGRSRRFPTALTLRPVCSKRRPLPGLVKGYASPPPGSPKGRVTPTPRIWVRAVWYPSSSSPTHVGRPGPLASNEELSLSRCSDVGIRFIPTAVGSQDVSQVRVDPKLGTKPQRVSCPTACPGSPHRVAGNIQSTIDLFSRYPRSGLFQSGRSRNGE